MKYFFISLIFIASISYINTQSINNIFAGSTTVQVDDINCTLFRNIQMRCHNSKRLIFFNVNRMPRVLVLHATNNKIREIPEYTFANYSQLLNLWASHNEIEFITKESFFGLKDLSQLNLDFNRIRIIRKDLFSRMPNLQVLVLLKNIIEIKEEFK